MPTPIQSPQADASIGTLVPKETSLSSRQIKAAWDEKIRDRALFSARTTSQAYLDAVKKELVDIASRAVNPIVAETRLKNTLKNLGYRPEAGFPDAQGNVPPARPGAMTDLSSSRRIQLIIDTNEKQARSLGQIAASESPEALMTDPAWELRRTGARKKPRGDWARRWKAAGDACGWRGAAHTKMIALKTSPIWQKIGEGAGGFKDAIGAPYPPFAFGSGLAWRNVDWEDWEELCKREGIPDGLDDIRNKARELKAARTAKGQAAVAATVRPTGQGGGNGGPVGADVSPLLGDTKAKPPVQTVAKPDVGYKPNLASRANAVAEITAAATDVAKARAAVKEDAKATDAMRLDAVAAVREGGVPGADARAADFAGAARSCSSADKRLVSAEERINAYAKRVSATPPPADKAAQAPYDRAMRMYGSAARAIAASAREAVSAARAARIAAEKALGSVRSAIDDARRGMCEERLAKVRVAVDAYVGDPALPWIDRSRAESCYRVMEKIAADGDAEKLDRYVRHLAILVPGLADGGTAA